MAKHGGDQGGRPPITEIEKREILSKLEPYLKGGLNISKSISEAQVASATFYRLMQDDERFREKINRFRNFVPVLLNNVLVGELMAISAKQQGTVDKKGNPIKAKPLSKEDKDFLWKFALTSNITKGEFGERKEVQLFDPEAEIQKIKGILDESASTEIHHDD